MGIRSTHPVSGSQEQFGQVVRLLVERLGLAQANSIHPFVSLAGRAGQRLIGPVAGVQEPDLPVLPVIPSQRRLIIEREPMHADAPGFLGRVLEIHPGSPASRLPKCHSPTMMGTFSRSLMVLSSGLTLRS